MCTLSSTTHRWGFDCSATAAHDDPVSAARRHALRAVDQQHALRSSGFAAADQRQSLGVTAAMQQPEGQAQEQGQQQDQQQGRQQAAGTASNLRTLVLYIFSPTDPGSVP
jgi:hypothetical protein